MSGLHISDETKFLKYLGERIENIFGTKDDDYKRGYLDALFEVYTVYNSFIVVSDE